MSAPPETVVPVTPEEAAAIRAAVREARGMAALGDGRRLARPDDAEALSAFFADPAVSGPIYDLPRPFTTPGVRRWIEERIESQARGENLLMVNVDETGEVTSYSDVAVWPDRAAAEIAGARRADLQGAGAGGAGFPAMVDWIFDDLGARIMCLTAALDNARSVRMIDKAGFRRMGRRIVTGPDGSTRDSHYWEITRDEWRALRRGG